MIETRLEIILVSYGCIEFKDSYQFSSSSLNKLDITLNELKQKLVEIFEEGFPDEQIILQKNGTKKFL